MKTLLIVALLLLGKTTFAQTTFLTSKESKIYKPFRYETPCHLESKGQIFEDTCVVIETRETGGGLRTRNIFSNLFKLIIKGRFDKTAGYMTWDNYNQYEYKWDYVASRDGWTYVMPGVTLKDVSWD